MNRPEAAAMPDIVVAGHICLDVIPTLHAAMPGQDVRDLLVPGKLIDIGAAQLSTGGAVSNTGIALHRLGFPVKLMGKVGDDLFGQAILSVLRSHHAPLAEGMIAASGEASSYTIVISPPGIDRIFLHCTGANDTFSADDMDIAAISGAKLFHFGYPPLMRRMYENQGEELVRLLSRVKAQGITASLDMAWPDPQSPAGRADWRAILGRALPHVDVFLPSFEEILFMLRPQLYKELSERHGSSELLGCAEGDLLRSLSEEMLGMGAAIVGCKLGEHGLYVRATDRAERLRQMGACGPGAAEASASAWLAFEALAPCYQVEAAGTTGAGDCTIAGFLAGLTQGMPPEETLLGAVGTGACSVERADAASGIPSWEEVRRRIASGWRQREVSLPLPGWSGPDQRGIRKR